MARTRRAPRIFCQQFECRICSSKGGAFPLSHKAGTASLQNWAGKLSNLFTDFSPSFICATILSSGSLSFSCFTATRSNCSNPSFWQNEAKDWLVWSWQQQQLCSTGVCSLKVGFNKLKLVSASEVVDLRRRVEVLEEDRKRRRVEEEKEMVEQEMVEGEEEQELVEVEEEPPSTTTTTSTSTTTSTTTPISTSTITFTISTTNSSPTSRTASTTTTTITTRHDRLHHLNNHINNHDNDVHRHHHHKTTTTTTSTALGAVSCKAMPR